MNIGHAAGFSRPQSGRQCLISLLSSALLFATGPQNLWGYQDVQAPAQAGQGPTYTPQTPEQLQQLVAPIALYPDSLVAQILAASTFPAQVVEADRWVQAHPDLKGDPLAQAVDQQPWDPSVKALTAFPSILGNMDKNLSWTSSLGDAYYNQQQDVMDAVQVMRQRAQTAGNLKTTSEQVVTTQGSTVIVEPANPGIVYVPAYDPWVVYGYPIAPWPYWYPYPGIWFGGPYLSFGVGFGIGFFGGFGWGWGHWGCDWHNHYTVFNNARYYSRTTTFYNRNNYYRGGGERGVATNVQRGMAGNRGEGERGGAFNRPGPTTHAFSGNTQARGNDEPRGESGNRGGVYNHPGATTKPFSGNTQEARGYGEPRGERGVRSDALSGYDHGGEARSYSSRGSASFGGGGFHGGGGGGRFHGGGGHR